MTELLGIVATAIALAGVVLNNRRHRGCFAVWLVSNALTLGLHAHAGMWALASRDAAFLALAVHGWFCWARPAVPAPAGKTT